jgi:hypothetical protein
LLYGPNHRLIFRLADRERLSQRSGISKGRGPASFPGAFQAEAIAASVVCGGGVSTGIAQAPTALIRRSIDEDGTDVGPGIAAAAAEDQASTGTVTIPRMPSPNAFGLCTNFRVECRNFDDKSKNLNMMAKL